MSFQFQDFSLLWIFYCIIIAGGYSFILYRIEKKFQTRTRNILAIARGIVVFILMLFLFSPLITRKSLNYEKPIILLAQDNSQSILLNKNKSYYEGEYLTQFNLMKDKLSEKFDVKTFIFH